MRACKSVSVRGMKLSSAAVAALAVFVLPQVAKAQTAAKGGGTGVEEIVVTAEKRKTQLQKTPSAISALSATKLESQGIVSTEQLQFNVPAMTFGQQSGYSFIALRGIGSDVTTTAAEPSVASYTDGIYMGSITQIMPEFDLQRIEVLRGPQGTLYGRNATGGVINYVTKPPSFENEVNLAVLLGSYQRGYVEGGVSGPIIDDVLAYRTSFHVEKRNGFRHNIARDQDEDALDQWSGRGFLLFTPTNNLSITLSGDYLSQKSSNPYLLITTASLDPTADPIRLPLGVFSQPASFFAAGGPGAGLLSPSDVARLDGGSIAKLFGLIEPGPLPPDPTKSTDFSVQTPTHYDVRSGGGSATISWDVGDVTVKSITGYRYSRLDFDQESAGFAVPNVYFFPAKQDSNQWTQEFNISGTSFDGNLDWLVGTFYYHEQARFATNVYLPASSDSVRAGLSLAAAPGSPYPFVLQNPDGSLRSLIDLANIWAPNVLSTTTIGGVDPLTGRYVRAGEIPSTAVLGFSVEQESQSYAGFGQATYKLTDQLRVTGGLRYTIDEKDVIRSNHSNLINTFSGPASLCDDRPEGEKWYALTGTAGIDYDLQEKTLLYAKYSRGYKAGGFNAGECNGAFNPEKLSAAEIGIKSIFGGGQFSISAAGFYYDYTDIQFTVFVNNTSSIRNAGAAELYGLEIEYQARPNFAPDLSIDGSMSWIHSEYTEGNPFSGDGLFTDTAGQGRFDIRGNQVLRSPTWKFAIGAQYEFDLGSSGTLTLRGDAAWSDKYYNDIFNGKAPFQGATIQPAFWQLSARAIWDLDDGRYQVQVFGENLTDDLYATNRVAFATPIPLVNVAGQFSAPRTFGLRVSMKLDGF